MSEMKNIAGEGEREGEKEREREMNKVYIRRLVKR